MDNLRGIIFMLLAMAGFAVEDTLLKILARDLPISELLILLGLGGFLLFSAVVIIRRDPFFSPQMRNKPFAIRFVADIFAPLFFLPALAWIPLATVTSILQATPILVTMGAALVLKEAVGWRRWSAILVGFTGVLIVVRPGMDGFQPASILAIIGVVFLAFRDLSSRLIPPALSSYTVTAYAFFASLLAGLIALPFFDPLIWPDPAHWALMGCACVIGGLAYFCIVLATRIGDVSVIAPFRYSRLLFALAIAVTVLNEQPDWQTLAGAVIIIGSGLYTFWRENLRRAPQTA
ncbi:DMT family transporter [Rhodobacteraceae bacterium nBUS_22]